MARSSTSGQGRPKGAKNKKTAELQRRVARDGITPLDFMLELMRTEPKKVPDPPKAVDIKAYAMTLDRQFEAAKAAAPYIHARLTAVEATGKDGSPLIPPSPDPMEVARRVAFLLNSANQKPTTEG